MGFGFSSLDQSNESQVFITFEFELKWALGTKCLLMKAD